MLLQRRSRRHDGIAPKLAEGEGLELPLAKSTWKQYEKMKTGLGELDKSALNSPSRSNPPLLSGRIESPLGTENRSRFFCRRRAVQPQPE